MTPEIEAMSFDELRTLYREIGALIAARRHEVLQELKEKAALLGFAPADFIEVKQRKANVKYRDEAGNEWSGKGRKPAWVQAIEEAGDDIERFRIN
jgi:DNA-binding protein H-NS